jgi:hypothetical protein
MSLDTFREFEKWNKQLIKLELEAVVAGTIPTLPNDGNRLSMTLFEKGMTPEQSITYIILRANS